MVYHLNGNRADAYIYTNSTEKTLKSVDLHYRMNNGSWYKLTDALYPFEFSVPLLNQKSVMEFRLTAKALNGNEVNGEIFSINSN
jgi:hypothetical protein